MLTRSLPLSLAACLCTLVACSKDDGDTDPSASTSAATDAPGTDASSASQSTTDAPATTSGDASSDGPSSATTAASDPTTAAPTTAAPTTGNGETTGDGETTDPSAGETTTAPAPTDGPGVLPGETGIDSFCRRYVECGGTYYAGEQACLDETFDYWGECPSRRAALDAFGACMSELDCSEWNPDAYNPGSTPCAQQWSDLNASESC